MQMHAPDIARRATGYRKCFAVAAKRERHHFVEGTGDYSRFCFDLQRTHLDGARAADEQVFAIRRKS